MSPRAQGELFAGPATRARRSAAYPDKPGFKARETSRDAAEGIEAKAETLRERVFAAIRMSPSTPEQVAMLLGEPLMNVRPRCSELSKKGRIADTGHRREALGGREAIVWKAVEA